MFIQDRPIKSKNEDLLGRINFSDKLGQSLSNWKEKDSLVVALYGKWGLVKVP